MRERAEVDAVVGTGSGDVALGIVESWLARSVFELVAAVE